MNHYLYVRVGSAGELEQFPNIEAVAAYLNTLFWGDDLGKYLESIATRERLFLDGALDDAELMGPQNRYDRHFQPRPGRAINKVNNRS